MVWVLSYGSFTGEHCATATLGCSERSRTKFAKGVYFIPVSLLRSLLLAFVIWCLQMLWREQWGCNFYLLRLFDISVFHLFISLLHRTHFLGLLSGFPTARPHIIHTLAFLEASGCKLCKGQHCFENDTCILWSLKLQLFSETKIKRSWSKNILFAVIKMPRSIWTGGLQVLITSSPNHY